MNDTDPKTAKKFAAMMAAREPAERLRMASSMFDTGRILVLAGLKEQNPELNEAQLRKQLFIRLYGADFTKSEIDRIVSKIPNMES